MFEYMAGGLAVVASDFQLYREVVSGSGCGMLVDPGDTESIARGIIYLLDNPGRMKEMARHGIEAFVKKYNWDSQEKKLIELYDRITT